jgi:diacylglycerol kinase
MKDKRRFTFKNIIKSFRYAFKGLNDVFTSEHNLWIHTVAAIVAVVLGIILGINRYDWIVITLATGMVFTAELFNSAVERMVNYFCPDKDVRAGVVKNISAAAVLITAIISLIAGLLIFVPKIISLLK